MIAVDTNILVYSHRLDMPRHREAFDLIKRLAEGGKDWAIAWPSLHEFYSVVTNGKIFKDGASSPEQAVKQIEAWLKSPSLMLLSETEEYAGTFLRMTKLAAVSGPLIHDLRILSICEVHDVEELWTCDRDFSRLPTTVRVTNPFGRSHPKSPR